MSSLILPSGPKIWDPRMPDGLRDELLFLSTAEHRGGTLYHDDSEREHHATLFDFASPPPWEYSDPLDRHGLRWDGSNDYVRAANTPFHTTAWTALTMGGWIALDSGQSSPGWAMGFGSSSSNGAHLFYRTAPDTWCWAVGGTERRTNTTFPEDGKLHHIVGVFRAGTMLIYVDGKLDDTDAGPASTGTSIYPWTLGASPVGSGANVLNGPIFDPFIYGRDLSGPEIEWIANPAHHFRVPWRRKSWLVGASFAPFAINPATGAITITKADQLAVGDTVEVVVRATDALDDTDDGTWTVELVAGGTFQAAWAEGINSYIGVGV